MATQTSSLPPPTEYKASAPFHDIKPNGLIYNLLKDIYSNVPKPAPPFQDNVQLTDEVSFLEYMRSPASSAEGPIPEQDLDPNHPLSAYYISSSHNTYLSGNQLYGTVSIDAYTNVLRRGCRCLEIDVWNGGESGGNANSSDEEGETSTGHQGSESKPSRWSRMVAKAANIRGSSSIPTPHIPSLHRTRSDADADKPSATDTQQIADGEPIVLHGFTLTQSVSFRAVCQAIKDSAFVASDLPLIVSLEVHASLEQQQKMVDIIKELWKDHLLDLKSIEESSLKSLPSPSSLRNKILIKVKWTQTNKTDEPDEPPLEQVISTDTQGSVTSQSQANATATASTQKKSSKILPALSELGVYTRAVSFRHWDQPEALTPNHVFSFSEDKMLEMHSDKVSGPLLFKHNQKFLTRVYPRGTRIRSSNIDPAVHWRMGAQMVALNWQTLDLGMMLNQGLFSGTQGWILKPQAYRAQDLEHPTLAVQSPSTKGLLDLKIQLLAVQDLPLPQDKDTSYKAKLKPYVQIQLHIDTHGAPGQGESSGQQSEDDLDDDDENKKKNQRRTKTVVGSDTSFQGEVLSWAGVSDADDELSFVRFKIKDDRALAQDNLIAWACIRLDRLRTGLRFIHLLDTKGQPSKALLLVRVSKQVYTPAVPAKS